MVRNIRRPARGHRGARLSASPQADRADEVDQFTEAVADLKKARIFLRQNPLEAWVVALDGDHGVVDDPADGGLLGARLEKVPACVLGDPKRRCAQR